MLRSLILCSLAATVALADGPYLYKRPAVSKTHIVFEFADDLWIVARTGGVATRLTTGPGMEGSAQFSPDGQTILFSGNYDGSTDLFTIPLTGGIPKRITFHPGGELAVGWTPDGKRALFMTQAMGHNNAPRLFTVSPDGGMPEELPLPTGSGGVFSADGKQLAYTPFFRADLNWKRYRGGRVTPIWIANLTDSSIVKIPRTDSNDHSPMWIGNKVYFLSDRGGNYTIWSYDTGDRKVAQVLDNKSLDIKSASATSDAIAYEQFGEIKLLDLKTAKSQPVSITLNGADIAGVRSRMEKVGTQIRNASISPNGVRAVFEARGDIYTVPAEKGDIRNLTASSASAERDPAWSPDGKSIAYFSDESGEYRLHVRDQLGRGEVQKIDLEDKPTFYYNPVWSPDSKKIAYVDKKSQLWMVDLDAKKPVLIDKGTYHWSLQYLNPGWSPDSQWIVYNKNLKNHLCQVMLYSLKDAKSSPVTDGMSDAQFAVFDRGGKYLYFAASTNAGPSRSGLDMSSNNRPITRSLYAVVLSKSDPSPLAPESDEEKAADEKKPDAAKPDAVKPDAVKPDAAKKDEKAKETKIDLDGISQRIVALPMPPRNYSQLDVGKTGILFVVESPVVMAAFTGPGSRTMHRFDLSKRKAEKFMDGLTGYAISANGEKMLYSQGPRWAITGTTTAPKPGEGTLKTTDMETMVDPKAEWRQMYREAWRLERDWFYDPNLHGVNLADYKAKYEKYLNALGSRGDLNYLFGEMLGELSIGHLYIQGGDNPDKAKVVKGGLLGADYKIENNRYRFARVYNGESWNPELRAPLTQPGVNVQTGEYLLAVNGRDLTAAENIYAAFEATAGKSILLRVGPNPSNDGSREATVVPVETEYALRTLAWMEDNRRKVDQMSSGKLAYVHLPDTGLNGYEYFNRYYFAQTDRQGAIIDERWNRGGQAADYIIDNLRRPLWNYWSSRDHADYATPATQIFGPKVMIANEYSGSGGDLLPWMFKRAKIGPLVGTRTWGGLVGIGGYPQLIDGGMVTAPHFGFWNPDGKWEVENHGTDPDFAVEMDPKLWREGRDPQLEKAVELAMADLKKNPPPVHKKPAFPNYHKAPVTPSGVSSGGGSQR